MMKLHVTATEDNGKMTVTGLTIAPEDDQLPIYLERREVMALKNFLAQITVKLTAEQP